MEEFEVPPQLIAVSLWTAAALVVVFFVFACIRMVRRQSQSPRTPAFGDLPLPPDVRDEISRLDDFDTAEAAKAALVARGADVVPHLLAALPAVRDEPQIEPRLVVVLGEIGDPRSQAPLEEMVRKGAPSWGLALSAVVALGTPEAAQFALEVLDGYESSHTGRRPPLPSHDVYDGIVRTAKHGRVTPAFREALLLPVLRRVGERWPEVRPNAADAALALDPDTAAQVLLSSEVLDRGADAAAAAVAALFDAGRAVGPDLAMSLATGLPVRAPRTPSERFTLGVLLTALARSGHPRAEETIRSFDGIADETTQDIVRAALEALGDATREQQCGPEPETAP